MQLSPEEQELAEEMAEMMSDHGYGSGSEAKPGEPQFVFVARISEEDRRQAMTEAFAKAQASAARVAAAAGKELGELAHLQSNSRGAARNCAALVPAYMWPLEGGVAGLVCSRDFRHKPNADGFPPDVSLDTRLPCHAAKISRKSC
jgi:hypothetical protein